MVAIFKKIWEKSLTKSYHTVSLLFVINKFFENFVNNMLVDNFEKFGFLLISSLVSGLLIQPHFFWHLHLIEFLGLLIGLWLLKV